MARADIAQLDLVPGPDVAQRSDGARTSQGRGMGGHHRPNEGLNDEWITPRDIIQTLGPFDLDPCAPVTPPWPIAPRTYTSREDGLSRPWSGFIWCNPPYGPHTWRWLTRLAEHEAGGIALIFARTETDGFFAAVWERATSILFLRGRLFFHHVDGARARSNAGAPSCLVAYGAEADRRLSDAHAARALIGALVPLRVRSVA